MSAGSEAPGLEELEPFICEVFVRSSGPGGQNVNKVATAVQLSFDVARAPLAYAARQRLRTLAGSRISADTLRIDARRHRTREQNRRDARERLLALIAAAKVVPKRRRATRVPGGERRRRLEGKRRRGDTKKLRGRVRDGE